MPIRFSYRPLSVPPVPLRLRSRVACPEFIEGLRANGVENSARGKTRSC